MSIILANFGKYAISDCPFMLYVGEMECILHRLGKFLPVVLQLCNRSRMQKTYEDGTLTYEI